MPDRRANSRFSKNASFKARLSIFDLPRDAAPAGHLINLITHLVFSNQGWFDNTKWYQIWYQITEICVQATSELYCRMFPSVKTFVFVVQRTRYWILRSHSLLSTTMSILDLMQPHDNSTSSSAWSSQNVRKQQSRNSIIVLASTTVLVNDDYYR